MEDEGFAEWIRENREILENLRGKGVLTPDTIKNIDEIFEEK
jgi:hypothetical protein